MGRDNVMTSGSVAADPVKLVSLGDGISIWRVHVDHLREQTKNARFMSARKFDRLSETIAKDQRLESLPLCSPLSGKDNDGCHFEIISGHHRTRAARSAGVGTIVIMSFDDQQSPDKIKAAQLAHNSIAGEDDAQILSEIYNEILDIEARLESAITNEDMDFVMSDVKVDEISLQCDWEILNIVFLPKQADEFDELIEIIMKDPCRGVYAENVAAFEDFAECLRVISGDANTRNMGGIMTMLAKYAKDLMSARDMVRKGKPEK